MKLTSILSYLINELDVELLRIWNVLISKQYGVRIELRGS